MKFGLSLKKQLFILIVIQILFGIIIQSYYSINLSKLLSRRLVESADNNIDKIISVLENKQETLQYIGETLVINSFHQDFLNEEDLLKRVSLKNHIENSFNEICERNSDIYDIKLLSPDADILIERNGNTNLIIRDVLVDYPYEELTSAITTRFYHDEDIRLYGKKTAFFFYFSPIYSTAVYTGKPLGYILVVVSMISINNYVEQSGLPEDSSIFIVDNNNRIGSSIDPERIYGIYNQTRSNNPDNYFSRKEIDILDWMLYTSTSYSEIETDIRPVIKNGLIFFLIAMFLMIMFSIVLFNSIVAPIKKLVEGMRAIGKKKNDKVESSSNNEIEQISREINSMLNKIEESNSEMIRKNKTLLLSRVEKKKAQIQALQSQINPHFLYNTLESIRMMSLTEDRKDVARAIKVLAGLFRYSTKTGITEVSLEEELNHVKNYTELLKIRYEENVVIDYSVDERLLKIRTMKFILQPIVENAFQHGLNKKKGLISIELKKSDDRVLFSVSDSGSGINRERLNELKEALENDSIDESSSIGMFNVNNRIKLQYGTEFGLAIESEPGAGTVVTVALPGEV